MQNSDAHKSSYLSRGSGQFFHPQTKFVVVDPTAALGGGVLMRSTPVFFQRLTFV